MNKDLETKRKIALLEIERSSKYLSYICKETLEKECLGVYISGPVLKPRLFQTEPDINVCFVVDKAEPFDQESTKILQEAFMKEHFDCGIIYVSVYGDEKLIPVPKERIL